MISNEIVIEKRQRQGNTSEKVSNVHDPTKDIVFRKRKHTPEEWKKNKRKTLRLSGMEYISQRGKTVSARKVKPLDCTNCKYKCTTKVNEKERKNIFETFWSINSYQ